MKKYIKNDFVAAAPPEWVNYEIRRSFNNDSELYLIRYNPEVKLRIRSDTPLKGYSLDDYIECDKTLYVGDEIISEEYVNIDGVKGVRIDWKSHYPSEFDDKTLYDGGTDIVFLKNRFYELHFRSDIKSLNESNISEINEDINFIISNFNTKSPNEK